MTNDEIVKISLEKDVPREERAFKKMPILYLELVENKTKVKPDLINKLYEPTAPIRAQPDVVAETGGDDVRPADRVPETEEEAEAAIPPTLAELQAKNPKQTFMKKHIGYPVDDDDEAIRERNEVYFHYEVLKRMHPNASIPEFTIYSDPKIMAQKYELLAKRLSLDSSVENWKRYLIIFVMGCEVVLGKLKFDMEGFAQQQIMSMSTYESLLVEMAEKSYVPKGSKWPVEMRLFGMLLINVVMFVFTKQIAKLTGMNLLGTINQLTNVRPDRVMKEPTLDKI